MNTTYSPQLEQLFDFYAKLEDPELSQEVLKDHSLIQHKSFLKFAQHLDVVPNILEHSGASFVFSNVTKSKQVYGKEGVRALRYEDFLEAIVKICVLGKRKLGVEAKGGAEERHDLPVEWFELKGVTVQTIENFLKLLGLVAGEKRGPIVQVLKKLKQQNKIAIASKKLQAKHEAEKNEENKAREDSKLEVYIKPKDNDIKVLPKSNTQKPLNTQPEKPNELPISAKHDIEVKQGGKSEAHSKSSESVERQKAKKDSKLRVNELQDSREDFVPIDTSSKMRSVLASNDHSANEGENDDGNRENTENKEQLNDKEPITPDRSFENKKELMANNGTNEEIFNENADNGEEVGDAKNGLENSAKNLDDSGIDVYIENDKPKNTEN